MQDGIIGDGASLSYIATDKGVQIGAGKQLSGSVFYSNTILPKSQGRWKSGVSEVTGFQER